MKKTSSLIDHHSILGSTTMAYDEKELAAQKRRTKNLQRTLILSAAIVGVLVLFVNMSGDKFRQRVVLEKQGMLKAAQESDAIKNSAAAVAQLPKPVRKYIQFALGNDLRQIRSVNMEQHGMVRTGARDNWVTMTADQLTIPGTASFVWRARLEPLPYVWMEGRDILSGGRARTEQRLYSAFAVGYEAGKETDLSALVRFLAETPWYPTALLPNERLAWHVIDDNNAKAVLSVSGYQVSAVFTFGERGEITKITTQDRYKTTKGVPEKSFWTGYYGTYDTRSGVRVPLEMAAEWDNMEKKFKYLKVNIDAINFERI